MTLGLIVSLLVTFLLLPSLISLLTSDNEINVKDTEKSFITKALASFTKKKKSNTYFCIYYVNNCSKCNWNF